MKFELAVEKYYVGTKKEEGPINGRIGFRPKKKDWTSKDVCLTNGRLGLKQKNKKNKNSPPFTITTKKDRVGMNGRIGSRQIKVGVEQTVE